MNKQCPLIMVLMCILLILQFVQCDKPQSRYREQFDQNWTFHLGDAPGAEMNGFDDSSWRGLNVPHDWSIEGEFSETNPATPGGGALPGGVGWYRKTFKLDESLMNRNVFIEFDGIYMNSDVWINGHHLGNRPYGYISFEYELTPFLKRDGTDNVLAVRVDNSQQPNSRWYSGSGIYRHVWLTAVHAVHVDHWGTCITTPRISSQSADINIATVICNAGEKDLVAKLTTFVIDEGGKIAAKSDADILIAAGQKGTCDQTIQLSNPRLWQIESPALYRARSTIRVNGDVVDDYETTFGIRSFHFDEEKGFILNGEPVKINGVCNHHDLGCLGAAVNRRALQRQLEMLKEMGCNGIRTSHNPPAPELLELCDEMGFIVMDEAFDMWKKSKNPFDYSIYWDEWHERDLRDFILRDRNHPSIFMWSIGNEILEQWHETGLVIAEELAAIVRGLDQTRPITSACNDPRPENFIIRSGALDLIGYNYHHQTFADFKTTFPGQKFIATETGSAIATRGIYDLPSDVIRRWPVFKGYEGPQPNADLTCSAYDNCCVPWGSTHEETWSVMKKHDFLSGMFYWTGFDYLGEPTPYWWPARSSYFGIIDLAGFPKDAFYLYQSEWTRQPVLHLFPHWNWDHGDTVDVWVYTNLVDVELYLNGKSLGRQVKSADDLHLIWQVPFESGVLKAIAHGSENQELTQEIRTAGNAAALKLTADRSRLQADGEDLSFITVDVTDADGTIVPHADHLVHFTVTGPAQIVGVDNGNPISHESFKAKQRKAFHGKCLVVVQTTRESGEIKLYASSDGLPDAEIALKSR